MLLDEPFSALDTGLRASTRKAVARLLADSGVTTLLVTHDQEEALSIADQIAVMRDGRFTQVGAPQDVYRRPNDRFTAEFLGDCIALPCTVDSGFAECALGRVPVQTSVGDGPATLALRPEQLVATVISDSAAHVSSVGARQPCNGIGTVVATEFLGHDVLLTDRPRGRRRTDHRAAAQPRPPADRRQGSHRCDRQRGRPEVTPARRPSARPRRPGRRADRRHLADLPRTRRSGGRRRCGCSAATRRLVLVETRNDLATLVHYLGALAGDHVVLPMSPGRDHSAVLRAYDPDVVIDGDGIARAAPRQCAPVAPRPRAAAVDVGQHRLPEVGRLSRRNLVANAESIADYLDIRRNRQGRNDSADVVLLRAVGDPQPPAPRRRTHPDRSLGRRRRFLDGVPRAPRHIVRRRALHLRDARPDRLRRHRPTRPSLRHPGRRPAATGTRAQLRGARRAQRLAAVRHVRRDRGDRQDGLPATGTRGVAARLDRATRSPAARSRSNRSTVGPNPTWASWCTRGPTS